MASIVFISDQLTKTWIFNHLRLDSYEAIEVIKGFFYIIHVGNEGAAWGILAGYGGYLAVFALVALMGIYLMRHSLELHRRSMQWAFGLLSGGILGNMIDRLIHGHVIDFLDFHFPFSIPYIMPTGHYPTFNLADCGIVIGTLLYMSLSFRQSSARPD